MQLIEQSILTQRQTTEPLTAQLTALLFRHDPVHITYETNWDEYAPEALNIRTRLNSCLDFDDVCRVVYEELVRSFGAEAIGPLQESEPIAAEAWALWRKAGAFA